MIGTELFVSFLLLPLCLTARGDRTKMGIQFCHVAMVHDTPMTVHLFRCFGNHLEIVLQQ